MEKTQCLQQYNYLFNKKMFLLFSSKHLKLFCLVEIIPSLLSLFLNESFALIYGKKKIIPSDIHGYTIDILFEKKKINFLLFGFKLKRLVAGLHWGWILMSLSINCDLSSCFHIHANPWILVHTGYRIKCSYLKDSEVLKLYITILHMFLITHLPQIRTWIYI